MEELKTFRKVILLDLGEEDGLRRISVLTMLAKDLFDDLEGFDENIEGGEFMIGFQKVREVWARSLI